MFRSIPSWAKLLISGVAVAGTAAGGLAAASAAPTSQSQSLTGHPVTGCVNISAKPYKYAPWRGVWQVYTGRNDAPDCPEGSFSFAAASEAQLQSVSDQVQQNTQALGSLQGVGTAASTTLQDANAVPRNIVTGGGFVANATEIGTVSLSGGTYLLNFNAKATPNKDTGSAQVFPQFFVYNQAKNASFAGDVFNVGTGALEPYSTGHDSYFSGSDVVTIPAGGQTLHIYAFGYDSDRGAGTYALDSATITAVQLAG